MRNSPPRLADSSAVMQALATARTSAVEMKFSSPREIALIMFSTKTSFVEGGSSGS